MSEEQKIVKVSEVLNALHSGKTREEVRVDLGISKAELRMLFQHPQLKGRKTTTSRATSFVIEDDVTAPGTQEAEGSGSEGIAAEEGASNIEGQAETTPEKTRRGSKAVAAEEASAPPASASEVTEEAPKEEEDKNPWDI